MIQPCLCLLTRSMLQTCLRHELITAELIRILERLLQCGSKPKLFRYVGFLCLSLGERKRSPALACRIIQLTLMPVPVGPGFSFLCRVVEYVIYALRLLMLRRRAHARQRRGSRISTHQCSYKRRCACTCSCGTASYYQLGMLIVYITKPGYKAAFCLCWIWVDDNWEPLHCSSTPATVPVICAKSAIPGLCRIGCLLRWCLLRLQSESTSLCPNRAW